MTLPETRYARNNGLHVAYQLVGDGPVDVVLLTQWFSNIDSHGMCRHWRHSFAGSRGSAVC